jgi:hypothetical protein
MKMKSQHVLDWKHIHCRNTQTSININDVWVISGFKLSSNKQILLYAWERKLLKIILYFVYKISRIKTNTFNDDTSALNLFISWYCEATGSENINVHSKNSWCEHKKYKRQEWIMLTYKRLVHLKKENNQIYIYI